MDHRELDHWRKLHPDYTYWCGIQLGGCGGELSDRRYTDKVCHFAHHPNAVCHRTANGESSADHLFIKRGVERLLERQGVPGKVSIRDLGAGPGGAVDLLAPGIRLRVRFQLGALDFPAWRRATDELDGDDVGVDWILAQDGPVSRELLDRQGFLLRVRLVTHGGERRVHIGVQAHGHPLHWALLEECTLSPTGLLTPHLESMRPARPRPEPACFPIQGALVFAPVPGGEATEGVPVVVGGDRRLLTAYVKPVSSAVTRAFLSVPADTEIPLAGQVYRVPDGARVLVADGGTGWVVAAERYIRLNADEAQRTGLWSLSPVPAVACERPSVGGTGQTGATAESSTDVSRPTSTAGTAADDEAPPGGADHRPGNSKRARDLISQLRPLEGALGEAAGRQVTRAINGAELWLAAAANERGGAANEGGRHVRQLELALRTARRDLHLEEEALPSIRPLSP
ncbi:hypothetical protein [Streptomyces sp. SID2888]|uniref:hypothetical protein n=1 Tax=Streptomyces sp. SID2888 TaxID=2690256 RepID=UPI00136EDB77|nr:hypothetical protein [Streptomyces sp. SID2888]MYV45264.1 hypothetical protein [Streptomyces sp. SID2888]